MNTTWLTIPAKDGIPSYTSFTLPLQKSEQDDRVYRLIRLENGLQAIIVQDVLADKAAACLEVAVGHLQDPFDMPGLAHFCEHMLSKGSGPFPAENDFLSFIRSNGGSRNAATGPAYTNYWFSVDPTFLTDAIPRLAAFFDTPLFTPSVTAREINAVDSENKKNMQNDSRRIFQLAKSLSVPGHPWTKFGTGNIDSLTGAAKNLESKDHLPETDGVNGDGGSTGREARRRLIDWWRNEYCAGRMTLAVLGKEPPDDLSNLIAKLFSPIRNLGLDPRLAINDCPWGPSEMGTIVFVKTIKDIYSFSLSFLLPYQQPHFRSKPGHFISHLVGHEGPGSIYAFLKKKGWVVSLSSGSQTWNRGIQTFQISGKLTKAGYLRYKNVLVTIYNYLSLLRSSAFPLYHHEEMRKLSEIHFRFREKTQPHSYVTQLASELAGPYPPEWLLSSTSLIREWDERLVQETLKDFVPERGRYMLMSQEHDNAIAQGEWKTEKWYGTQYCVEKLDDTLVAKAMKAGTNTELHLPHANPFIPTNLEVQKIEVLEPAKYPRVVRCTHKSRLWHKTDDQFWVPKAQVKLDIRSPLAYGTPRQAILTRLTVDLIEDALTETTYAAELAGLTYSISTSGEGVSVSLSGYNDKLPALMRTILSAVKEFVIDPERLAIMVEKLSREYKNFYLAQPSILSNYKLSYLLTPVKWTPAEKLEELQALSQDDVRQHRDELLSRTYIEMLVNGNFREQDAVDLMSMAEEVLATKPSASSEHSTQRSLILPEGANLVKHETLADPKELNSSLTYYCQFGSICNERLRATLDLTVHILLEPTFSQLRTKEQLGYIVSTSRWSGANSMGLCINIQSLRDPAFLESRVEAFLNTFRQTLEGWSEDDLEMQKRGLISKKLESLKNLREESSRFWSHIRSGHYDFIRHEKDATIIRDLSLHELLEAYNMIDPTAHSRRKLSVYTRSQSLAPATPPEGMTLIEDDSTFKAGLDVSPSPVPVNSGYFQDFRLSKSRL